MRILHRQTAVLTVFGLLHYNEINLMGSCIPQTRQCWITRLSFSSESIDERNNLP